MSPWQGVYTAVKTCKWYFTNQVIEWMVLSSTAFMCATESLYKSRFQPGTLTFMICFFNGNKCVTIKSFIYKDMNEVCDQHGNSCSYDIRVNVPLLTWPTWHRSECSSAYLAYMTYEWMFLCLLDISEIQMNVPMLPWPTWHRSEGSNAYLAYMT